MLTRLFNNLSIQASANALIISYFITGIAAYLLPAEAGNLNLLFFNIPVSALLYKVLTVVITPLLALWFNSKLIKLELLKANYYLIPLFSIQIYLLAFVDFRPDLVVAAPLLAFVIKNILSLISQESPLELCFDIGIYLGVLTLILPQAIFLIIGVWLAVIIFGLWSFRTLIIPMMGLFASYFIFFAVFLFFSEFDFFQFVKAHFGQIAFGVGGMNFTGLWPYFPIGVILIIALWEYIQGINQAKIKKRQFFNFNIGLLIFLILAGAFLIDRQSLYTILVFPISVLQVNLLQYLKKWWAKDLVYLAIICSLFIAVFQV